MLLLRRQHLMLFWWRKRMFGIHRKAPGILWIVFCLRWEVISWTAFENLSLYLILYWTGPQKLDPNGNIICHWNRAVNPPRLQILRIDGEWVIDDIIMQGTWSHFLGKKKAQKRCCFNCNIWPNWFTSHQSHYCLYYKGIPEFVRKCSMLTEK